MRMMGAFAGAFAIIGGSVAVAQDPQPTRTPEQIVCELSGDCGSDKPDDSKKAEKGKEASFSFRPVAAAPAGLAPAPRPMAQTASPVRTIAYNAPVRRPLAPRSAGGIDAAITFDNGSSAMTEAGRVNAQALAIALKSPKFEGHHFMIEGHTNSIGARDTNMKLSQDRADAVASFLTAQGVDPARIEPKGYGFDKPLPNVSPAAAANRRVQIVPVS